MEKNISETIQLTYYDQYNRLDVNMAGEKFFTSRSCPSNPDVIRRWNKQGCMVGLSIFKVSEIKPDLWRKFPEKWSFDIEILNRVDHWIYNILPTLDKNLISVMPRHPLLEENPNIS